jgi:hypothetical protein
VVVLASVVYTYMLAPPSGLLKRHPQGREKEEWRKPGGHPIGHPQGREREREEWREHTNI